MKLVQLVDPLHEYLVHLIEAYTARGIRPEEGMAVSSLWDAVVNRVVAIPDSEIQKMAGDPVADAVVECKPCYEEEGSRTCIRPSHQGHQTGPIQGT